MGFHRAMLTEVQRLPTSAARAVMPYSIDGSTYLAISQHARDIPGAEAAMNGGDSNIATLIYQWLNGAFVEVQQLPVSAGEDAEYFSFDGNHYLATASIRTGAGPYDLNSISTIFKWNGAEWASFQ